MNRPARAWPLALLLLSGCGMYGDLYLEEEAPRLPEITEAPPIAADEAAAGDAPNGTNTAAPGEDQQREDREREDRERGDNGAITS